MRNTIHKSLGAALALATLALIPAVQAQQRMAQPGHTAPSGPTYGPGVYSENGYTVNVPRNCYVSREQVRVGGQLIWRPLVTCPYDDYR